MPTSHARIFKELAYLRELSQTLEKHFQINFCR